MNPYTEGLHTGAAQTRRHSKQNPMHVLQNIFDDDPTASSSIMWRRWWKVVGDDDDLMEAACLYAFSNYYHQIMRSIVKPRPKPKPTSEDIKKQRDEISKLVEKAKRISLMELVMPWGKKLRDCTFSECSAAGGWFKVLATKGKPSEIVGKVLTEDDLHNIGKKK